jgi:hypothetical protein
MNFMMIFKLLHSIYSYQEISWVCLAATALGLHTEHLGWMWLTDLLNRMWIGNGGHTLPCLRLPDLFSLGRKSDQGIVWSTKHEQAYTFWEVAYNTQWVRSIWAHFYFYIFVNYHPSYLFNWFWSTERTFSQNLFNFFDFSLKHRSSYQYIFDINIDVLSYAGEDDSTYWFSKYI